MHHHEMIPNWQLFKIKFKPTAEFIKQIESRFNILKETPEYEATAKHINIQIGILNMRDREVGEEIMKEFIRILQS